MLRQTSFSACRVFLAMLIQAFMRGLWKKINVIMRGMTMVAVDKFDASP